MPRTTLTRRLGPSAAHRHRRPDWSDAENCELFGACAHPDFHALSYVCNVTVAAPTDAETRFIVDLGFLDQMLHREVRDRFDHCNINMDAAEFADGKLIPTGENRARFIAERMQAALARTTARVVRVVRVVRAQVAEDANLSSTYEIDA